MSGGVNPLADKAKLIDTINDLFIATDDRYRSKAIYCVSRPKCFSTRVRRSGGAGSSALQ